MKIEATIKSLEEAKKNTTDASAKKELTHKIEVLKSQKTINK